jgi:hypothetical protein
MACSRRSDIKMPAMATAQSARDRLRRVLGGSTRAAVNDCVICNNAVPYQYKIPRLSVSLPNLGS